MVALDNDAISRVSSGHEVGQMEFEDHSDQEGALSVTCLAIAVFFVGSYEYRLDESSIVKVFFDGSTRVWSSLDKRWVNWRLKYWSSTFSSKRLIRREGWRLSKAMKIIIKRYTRVFIRFKVQV